MKGTVRRWAFLALLMGYSLLWQNVWAQSESDEKAIIRAEDGLSFSKDSLFLLNFRFRMQNRAGIRTVGGDDLGIGQVDARVRRLRLRFDGFILNPKWQYYIQLSFSKADQDLEERLVPHPIRDAIMYYRFSPSFYIGFGQSKLPGNRQRVISSGFLQFADRSLANNIFTLDRDFGLFLYYTPLINQKKPLDFKAALTTGEGRNASPGSKGLAYTWRTEWYPLGRFTKGGDYSEGDLLREPKPRLAIGFTASLNEDAIRTGGQLGDDLFQPRDISTYILDMVFKHQGWMLASEWLKREVAQPFTFGPETQASYVYTGMGWNTQLSKMLTAKTELASRYTLVLPHRQMQGREIRTEQVLLGFNHYLTGHRLKLQANVGYQFRRGNLALTQSGNSWLGMVQVEFGI